VRPSIERILFWRRSAPFPLSTLYWCWFNSRIDVFGESCYCRSYGIEAVLQQEKVCLFLAASWDREASTSRSGM
jgi:hypothetical protein